MWPNLFASPTVKQQKADVLNKMRVVRPVVETGCAVCVLWSLAARVLQVR